MTVLNPQAETSAERGFHLGGAGAPARAITRPPPTLIFSQLPGRESSLWDCGEVSGQLGSPGLVNFEPQTSRSNLKVSMAERRSVLMTLGMVRRHSNGRLAMRHLSRN